MSSSGVTGQGLAIRTCRRRLRNLVGATIALQPGHRPHDMATILARQACQALGARQAVASVVGAGHGPDAPFRAIAGDARTLSDEHRRLLERSEGGARGIQTLVDPATRAVVAAAASIDDRNGRPVGALMVAGGDSSTFREDDIAVLVGLANIASLTLENFRLQERAQASEAEAVDGIRPVTGAMAGELIDLLTVILGHTSLLRSALAHSERYAEDITAIVAATERASRLISRLLAIGRHA